MDVDIVHPKPAGKDKKRLFKEGRCFFCHDKGHRANKCPKRRPRKVEGQLTGVEEDGDASEEGEIRDNDTITGLDSATGSRSKTGLDF